MTNAASVPLARLAALLAGLQLTGAACSGCQRVCAEDDQCDTGEICVVTADASGTCVNGIRGDEGEGAAGEGEGASAGEGEGASGEGEGASGEGEGASAGEGEGASAGEGEGASGEGEGASGEGEGASAGEGEGGSGEGEGASAEGEGEGASAEGEGASAGEGEGASGEGEGASGEGEGATGEGEGASGEGEGTSGEGEGEGEGLRFDAPVAVDATPGAIFVVAGDLDGDQKPDLVVANFNSGSVAVYMNTSTVVGGAPSFAEPVFIGRASEVSAIALADFNGDGTLDVVVAALGNQSVKFFFNHTALGDPATFSDEQEFPANDFIDDLAVADVNGDLSPDVVVASDSIAEPLLVLVNQTLDGSDTADFVLTNVAGPGRGHAIAAHDFDGDGLDDVVLGHVLNANPPNDPGSAGVALLPNTTNGTASFGVPIFEDSTALQPENIALADLNGDGVVDVATAISGGGVVGIYRTVGVGFAPRVDLALAPDADPIHTALGDLDGDGRPDVAAAYFDKNAGATHGVAVFLNRTEPLSDALVFAPRVDLPGGRFPNGLAIADVNGDGKLDLIQVDDDVTGLTVAINRTP